MKRDLAVSLPLLVMVIVAVAVFAVTCIGEDLSLCETENNLTVIFLDKEGSRLTFQNGIHSVDLFLFDEGLNYLEHRKIERTELDIFRGSLYNVSPGIYHLVAWANVDGNSRLSAMDGRSNYENSYVETVSTVTGSPLCYAPYKTPLVHPGNDVPVLPEEYAPYSVEVPPNGKMVRELIFGEVCRTIRIYVKGYEDSGLFDGKGPVAVQANVVQKQDFLLRADPALITFRQPTTLQATEYGDFFFAEFHSLLIPFRDDMGIYLHHPTHGDRLAEVNLQRYIAAKNIRDDSEISILFIFDTTGTAVKVTMPNWLDNLVDPG